MQSQIVFIFPKEELQDVVLTHSPKEFHDFTVSFRNRKDDLQEGYEGALHSTIREECGRNCLWKMQAACVMQAGRVNMKLRVGGMGGIDKRRLV